jgi:hypothetical protein
MRCRRCSGLMVSDAYSASYDAWRGIERATLRCINCGALVDCSIRKMKASDSSRTLQPQEGAVRELRRKYPIRASMAMQGTTEDE